LIFFQVQFKTSIGQCLDIQASPIGSQPNLQNFTMEKYGALVKHKTGYYSFYLPVALAMYMAGITDRELHRQARTILLEMGSFFQVQDDFLDCFGNPTLTGKIGTDIAEGKCSWLAVVALQRASGSQRKVMQEHYGRKEKESVERVRELYKELNLPATYKAYEESTSALIRTHIQQISRGLNHNVFFKFLDKIYKRSS
ncbi:UNVERIFIED_CONTAM: hypothetical protein GTU68_012223, partial [Idotea baltica]|nr:hypothetical protein [Idotea baltica]